MELYCGLVRSQYFWAPNEEATSAISPTFGIASPGNRTPDFPHFRWMLYHGATEVFLYEVTNLLSDVNTTILEKNGLIAKCLKWPNRVKCLYYTDIELLEGILQEMHTKDNAFKFCVSSTIMHSYWKTNVRYRNSHKKTFTYSKTWVVAFHCQKQTQPSPPVDKTYLDSPRDWGQN